jgi:hypothetical protein
MFGAAQSRRVLVSNELPTTTRVIHGASSMTNSTLTDCMANTNVRSTRAVKQQNGRSTRQSCDTTICHRPDSRAGVLWRQDLTAWLAAAPKSCPLFVKTRTVLGKAVTITTAGVVSAEQMIILTND